VVSDFQSLFRALRGFIFATGFAWLWGCVLFGAKTDPLPVIENAIPVFVDSLRPEADPSSDASFEAVYDAFAAGLVNPILLASDGNPLRSPGSALHFNLFANQSLFGRVEQVKDHSRHHFVAKGRILGAEDADFLITYFNGVLSASLRGTPAGNYRIRLAPQTESSLKNDTSSPVVYQAERMANAPEVIHEWPVIAEGPEVAESRLPEAVGLAKRSATYQIDLAVVFEDNAATSVGGDNAMKALIVASVDEANDALEGSGIDLSLRLVDTSEVTFTSKLHSDSDLIALKTTDDGVLDAVHTLRNTVEADIVGLVVDSASNGVGSTYTMRANKAAFSSSAFFVLTRGALAVGQYGIAQFVARNMGCALDIKSAKKARGLYTYSRGYNYKGTGNTAYRTIVTGGTATRIPYFSNPKVTKFGKPTGSTAANNAKTLAKSAPTFAGFFGTDAPATSLIAYPATGRTFGGNALSLGLQVTDDEGIDSIVIMDVFGGPASAVGTKTIAPWNFYLTELDSGSHQLYATVYDRGGNSSNSDTITVTMGRRPLNNTWSDTYLGDKGQNAVVTVSADTLTIISKSKGVGNFDDVQFIHKTFPASGRLRVNLLSMTGHSGKARAGLMFKDSLTRDGRLAFLNIKDDDSYSLGYRLFKGKLAAFKALPGTYVDTVQLLLVRKGSSVNAFKRTGLAYAYLGKSNLVATGTVYGGLAFTSGDSGIIDTLRAYGLTADSSSNHPPTLATTGILAGTVYRVGDTVTLASTGSDLDGSAQITQVKFFTNTTGAATDSIAPYGASFPLPLGTSRVRSRIYDGTDSSESSVAVSVVDTQYRIAFPKNDTYLRDGRYESSIYGEAQNLFARQGTTDNLFMSLLTFSIAGVDSVASATLRFYGALSMADTNGVQIEIFHYEDTSWTESGSTGIKYSTLSQDDVGAAIDTLTLSETIQAWHEIDVTDLVSEQRADTATAISFGLRALDSSSALGVFNSNEHTQGGRPQLILSHP
jgi:hypothetical protein